MPATRNNIWELVHNQKPRDAAASKLKRVSRTASPTLKTGSPTATGTNYPGRIPEGADDIYFPTSGAERQLFRTSAGKKVTAHHWAVYDHTLTIPLGQVSTYKLVCEALGQGSPRSVGSALRNNPFAPFVPCHRVIASNLYLGGFCGEWGPDAKTGSQFGRKLEILSEEGVLFDSRGVLRSKGDLWQS